MDDADEIKRGFLAGLGAFGFGDYYRRARADGG